MQLEKTHLDILHLGGDVITHTKVAIRNHNHKLPQLNSICRSRIEPTTQTPEPHIQSSPLATVLSYHNTTAPTNHKTYQSPQPYLFQHKLLRTITLLCRRAAQIKNCLFNICYHRITPPSIAPQFKTKWYRSSSNFRKVQKSIRVLCTACSTVKWNTRAVAEPDITVAQHGNRWRC